MSAPLRLGLVGCGRLAEQGYVPAAALAGGVRLVAVADPEPDRRFAVAALARASGQGEVEAHRDAGAMLDAGDIDALVLATPAAHHVADAEEAVVHGIPVLVEKPPAPDVAGARALAALGPGVRIGFNRRFDPAVVALRAALPADVRLDLRLSIAYRRDSWSAHTVRDEVLLDLVPHLVDWARWLTGGEVRSAAAEELRPDRAVLALAMDRARVTVTAAADRVHEERIEVRDARGRVVGHHRTGGPVGAVVGQVRAVADRVRGRQVTHLLATSLAAQLDAFAAAVRGADTGALATAADGVAVMAVVDAARASAARAGVPVSVPDLQEHSC